MTFKPRIWFPIASILSAVNLGAVWFAAAPGEPLHATGHAVLAVAFAMWAQRLKSRLRSDARMSSGAHEVAPGVDTLALDVDELRQQLAETQERLDFAERVLAQGERVPREGPPR